MLRLTSLMSVFAVGALGCVDLPGEEIGPIVDETEQAIGGGCGGFMCGMNSPEVDSVVFHDLSLLGLPNDKGFIITKFRKGGTTYNLDVAKGKLTGYTDTIPRVWITGAGLTNSEIWLRKGGVDFVVRVTSVINVNTYAKLAGVTKQVEAYVLDWSDVFDGQPINEWRNICNNIPNRDNPDLMGLGPNRHVSFVFEGERILADKKIITGMDNNWFNIGCAGHTLAKMVLTGHTEASKAKGFITTIDERQTIIKMFSADYCGLGHPFTVAGVRLEWQDDRGWMTYPPTGVASIEARWGPDGAKCLTKPRLIANPTPESNAEFPWGVNWYIAQKCPALLQPSAKCPGNEYEFLGHHMVSGNP